MFTEFGKMLKKLMIDEGISQGQLAKDLGISPAILSNYMTGKNIPEMRILEKCIERFKLEKGDLKEIFSKAFSSAAKANHKIILDTRYFKEEWVDLLVQAITVLLLSRPALSFPDDSMPIDLEYTVKRCYTELDHREIKIDPL
jgi:transcriptional regulator with XRE-family HTH domain